METTYDKIKEREDRVTWKCLDRSTEKEEWKIQKNINMSYETQWKDLTYM